MLTTDFGIYISTYYYYYCCWIRCILHCCYLYILSNEHYWLFVYVYICIIYEHFYRYYCCCMSSLL